MRSSTTFWGAFGALALAGALTACAPATTAPDAAKATAAACANGAAKLGAVDMCPEAAEKLILSSASAPALPEGCTWAIQAAPIADADDPNTALLYRAARCKGVDTLLAFEQGAKSDTFNYVASAVFEGADIPQSAVVTRLEIESPDPKTDILAQAVLVAETDNERRNCEVRAAGVKDWPAEALVVDLNAAAKKRGRITDAEVRAACGFYGIDTGAQKYWLVKQGYAWFFDLGQEDPDFDPQSLTLVRKGADGVWAQLVPEPVQERN